MTFLVAVSESLHEHETLVTGVNNQKNGVNGENEPRSYVQNGGRINETCGKCGIRLKAMLPMITLTVIDHVVEKTMIDNDVRVDRKDR